MITPTTETNHYRIIVEAKDDNKQIRDILTNCGFSGRVIKMVKKEGSLLRNNKPVFFIDTAKKDDIIDLFLPEETRYGAKPVEGTIDIIYEDSEILVVNKPEGLVVHPTNDYQENTLANYVAHYFKSKGELIKVRFVNRLDRDTTGLVIIAKNKFVHHYIQSRMPTDQVKKTYTAFVENQPESLEGLIDLPIYRPDNESIERIIDQRGKESRTKYKVIEAFDNAAEVECELLTGRTHQIRVHMKAIGNPLIGDPLYNPDSRLEFARQALHARRLELPLPKSGNHIFEAPLSEDLIQLKRELGKKKENESEG